MKEQNTICCKYFHPAGDLHYLSARKLCLRSGKISLCGEFLCEKRIITKICQYICNVAMRDEYILGSVFYSSTVNFDNSFVVGNNGCSTLVCIMFNDIYRQGVSRYIYYRQSKAYRRIETGSHFFVYIDVVINSFQTVEPQLQV